MAAHSAANKSILLLAYFLVPFDDGEKEGTTSSSLIFVDSCPYVASVEKNGFLRMSFQLVDRQVQPLVFQKAAVVTTGWPGSISGEQRRFFDLLICYGR